MANNELGIETIFPDFGAAVCSFLLRNALTQMHWFFVRHLRIVIHAFRLMVPNALTASAATPLQGEDA